jgi:diguanylate cyclase (GGDEF)-like protein/PAS domain S-box-containing protein
MSDHSDLDLAAVIDNLHDGLYLVDRLRRIIYWNKAAERITGFTAAEVLGRRCADNVLIHVDAEGTPLCTGACPLAGTIHDRVPREASVFLHHKLGHRLPVSVGVTPLFDRQGTMVGAAESFSDTSSVEALHQRLAQLEHLSLIDPLTQLPNRRYVQSELESQLALLRRCGVSCGIALMDVDHFKRFNDDFGHDVGDIALQTVARTCSAVVRPVDVFGRWGGEEFVAVFPNADAETLAGMAGRLCRMVRHSNVECGEQARQLTVSVGATVARMSDTVDSVLRRADALMYASKRQGRNRLTTDSEPEARTSSLTRPPGLDAATVHASA